MLLPLGLQCRLILPFSAQTSGFLEAQSSQSCGDIHDSAHTSPLSSDQCTSLPTQPLPWAFQKPSKLKLSQIISHPLLLPHVHFQGNLSQCIAPPPIHIHSQKSRRHPWHLSRSHHHYTPCLLLPISIPAHPSSTHTSCYALYIATNYLSKPQIGLCYPLFKTC